MPDDPLILIAVGKVTIRHGQLELVLRLARRSFTKESVACAKKLTKYWSLRRVRDELLALAAKAEDSRKPSARFVELVIATVAASDRRNQLMHGLWGEELDGDTVFSTRDRPFEAPPTVAAIEQLASELEQLARDITFDRFANGFPAEP